MHVFTRKQIRDVDRIAIETFRVPGIVLMENASRGVVAAIVLESLPHERTTVLCGGGNNGGDGLAVARHLANLGSKVTVALCTDPAKYKGDAEINWRIVQAMNLPVVETRKPDELAGHLSDFQPAILVDAMFGTGLTDKPRPPFDRIVEIVNGRGVPVVAVDLPSGLDADTGHPLGGSVVRATLTVTFVGMKEGLLQSHAAQYSGKVVITDIGCPREAIEMALGISPQG